MNESLNNLQDLNKGLPIEKLLLPLVLRFFILLMVHGVGVGRIKMSVLRSFFQ